MHCQELKGRLELSGVFLTFRSIKHVGHIGVAHDRK